MLEYTVIMSPFWMPNNVHGRVPTQGRDDDLDPIKGMSLDLGDPEHVGRLTAIRGGAGRRPGDLGQVAHVKELDAGHVLSDLADSVKRVGGGVGGANAGNFPSDNDARLPD